VLPVAVTMNDRDLVRLLEHLNLLTELPRTKPTRSKPPEISDCGPTEDDGRQIDPKVDLYEGTKPPGDDDLPAA
jgi:hypothetical protein